MPTDWLDSISEKQIAACFVFFILYVIIFHAMALVGLAYALNDNFDPSASNGFSATNFGISILGFPFVTLFTTLWPTIDAMIPSVPYDLLYESAFLLNALTWTLGFFTLSKRFIR